MLTASAQFGFEKISKESATVGHILASLKAEDPDFKRTPVSLALVIDISGSMTGAADTSSRKSKIVAVKETAIKIVENLLDHDELSITVYGSHVETIVPRSKASDKAKFRAAIERISTMGCTNLSGGMLAGAGQLNPKEFKGVSRVLLLTDGQANEGVSDRDGLLNLVKQRQAGITLSTFGFGTDCAQDLLADMAKEGGGNYYFIDGANDAKAVFARELGGLAACQAQNIIVTFEPGKDVKVLEILNDYKVEDNNGVASIFAEDVYAGETKQVLIKVEVGKPASSPKARPFSIGHLHFSWNDAKTARPGGEKLNVKVTFVAADEADKEEVLSVAEQVALFQAAKAQLEAVRLANEGNFAMAQASAQGGAHLLRAVAARGSALGAQVHTSYNLNHFDAGNYSKGLGDKLSSNTRGFMKSRHTSDGSFSDAVKSEAGEEMVKNFGGADDLAGSKAWPQAGKPASGGGVVPPQVPDINVSVNVTPPAPATPVPDKSSSSFAKRPSRYR